MSITDIYNQRYLEGYRNSLSGYEVARWKALDHFITKKVSPTMTGGKILDYGGGSGLFIPLWRKLFSGAELFACDISSVALGKIAEKFADMEGHCALVKGNKAEWNDQMFDLIVSVEVMEHVEDLKAYLQDINRLLKPGGRFVWTTPCSNSLSIEHLYSFLTGQIEMTPSGSRRWKWEDPSHLRRLKTAEIKAELVGNGFNNVQFRLRSHLFSFLATYFPGKKNTPFREWLMTLDYSFFRFFPNGASMIGYAQKMKEF